jgi:hypothetical protein
MSEDYSVNQGFCYIELLRCSNCCPSRNPAEIQIERNFSERDTWVGSWCNGANLNDIHRKSIKLLKDSYCQKDYIGLRQPESTRRKGPLCSQTYTDWKWNERSTLLHTQHSFYGRGFE